MDRHIIIKDFWNVGFSPLPKNNWDGLNTFKKKPSRITPKRFFVTLWKLWVLISSSIG